MMNSYELERLKSAIANNTLDEYVKKQEEQPKNNFICDITWQVDDLRSLDEIQGLSEDEIQTIVFDIAGTLQDRSTEEGWQIMQDLVYMHEIVDNKRGNNHD